jgi:hypothetical protein
MGNFTEFLLISAVKYNSLSDVLNVPWISSLSNDGQKEDRAFGI